MSFSAEMKDFLGAYKTGQSINASRTDQDYKQVLSDAAKQKAERDNDPETLEAQGLKQTLENKKLADSLLDGPVRRAAAAASMGLTNAHLGLVNAQTKLYANGPPGTGLYPAGALPMGDPTTSPPAAATRGAVSADELENVGGMPAYADGGLVDDDGEPDPEYDASAPPPPQQGVLPTQADIPTPANAPTDVSARSRTPQAGLNGVISPQLVADAAHAGMTWGMKKAGLGVGAITTPAQMLKARQIAQGSGGLSAEEMEAASKAVDPDGKMTDAQRNAATLGSVYQFWANKGDPEKAQRVAFQALQYYRNASQRYAAIAAHAAQGGNLDLAGQALVKAYQHVPDGNDASIEKDPDTGQLMYAVTGPDGEVHSKGIATPQAIYSSAMGLVGGGFDKALMSAAGAQEAAPGAVKVGKPQSASDRLNETKLPTAAVKALQDDWQAKNKDQPLDNQFWGEMNDATQHIMQQNAHVTGREAAEAARTLLTPGAKDPEKSDFKLVQGEDGEPNTIRFNSGKSIQLDNDQLMPLINARTARVDAAVKKIDDDMKASDDGDSKAGPAARDILHRTGLDKTISMDDVKNYGHGVLQRLLPPDKRDPVPSADTKGAVPMDVDS